MWTLRALGSWAVSDVDTSSLGSWAVSDVDTSSLGSWVVLAGPGMLCPQPPSGFGSEDMEVVALPAAPPRSLARWEAEGRGRRLVIFSGKVDVASDSFFHPAICKPGVSVSLAMDVYGLHFHPSGSCGCSEVV